MSKVLAIDIDGTVLTEICYDWFYDLKTIYPLKKEWSYVIHPRDHKLPYDLSEMFEIPEGHDAFTFWYEDNLYDQYVPRSDAISHIDALHLMGYKIIFVSKVIGNHGRSKTNFINKYFPYNQGVILTGQKHHIKCDYLIDDCMSVLNKMSTDTITIKFRDDFNEGIQATRKHKLVYGFQDAFNYITTFGENV